MRKLSKISLGGKTVLTPDEMKKVKGGWTCYRSGSSDGGSFSTNSWEVASAWMGVWSSAGQDVRCYS
ncbi:hypothetical protein [Massilibacteroides vaginae]|uniref:hypothetical protein n=1 Tax=Massilibacteroides vaginae TaxID=1673718 RepID=UPI000A1CC904|nr:hypothetical protein [Massilibacteroides vaginae]